MTTKEVASGIHRHLVRFESDKTINVPTHGALYPYLKARAWPSGRWINIRYASYLGSNVLTKTQAETYLAWLDKGNVGKHSRLRL